jgi:hypothetical protein
MQETMSYQKLIYQGRYILKKYICCAGINVFDPSEISPPTFINGDINILAVQHAINLGPC